MFYKLDKKTGEWSKVNEVHFPDGSKLNKDNKIKKDDFEWFDIPPQAYLDYMLTIDAIAASQPTTAARKSTSTTNLTTPLTTKKSLWSRMIAFIKRIFVKQ